MEERDERETFLEIIREKELQIKEIELVIKEKEEQIGDLKFKLNEFEKDQERMKRKFK